MNSVNRFLPLFALFFCLWMIYTVFKSAPEKSLTPTVSLQSAQLAAIPPGFLREGKKELPAFDPRFLKIDPLTAFKIPTAHTFSSPLGSESGMFTYNAQAYWADNPHRGGHHTGDDLNGIGGGDSDLGDPVYAVADGLVVYSGTPSPGWGKVIILAHRVQMDGKEEIIQSLYAHLEQQKVSLDQLIPRGTEIGSVGTAEGAYLAHLHFEIRKGVNLYIGPGYVRAPRTHLSPKGFLRPFLSEEGIFSPSLMELYRPGWQDIEMKAQFSPEELLRE